MKQKLRGLYAITENRPLGAERLAGRVEAAIAGGARVIQYRDKSSDADRRLAEARALRNVCDRHDALLLINDDVDLAAAVGADGVHLGRDDLPLTRARERLGADCIIGVSCYNQFERAVVAAAQGADYVAFGSFYASPTKPDAVRAELGLLEHTHRELGLPTVAIGGISPENGAALVQAGADMLAVISALFASDDIRSAAEAFARCFDTSQEAAP